MKISFPVAPSPFARPQASFDRPSRAFADFLGDTGAQFGAAPDQASTFGAKGMFGSAVADRASLFAPQPAAKGPEPEPEPDAEQGPSRGENSDSGLMADEGHSLMADAGGEAAASELVETDARGPAGAETSADPGSAALPSSGSILDSDATAPMPGSDLDAILSGKVAPEGPPSTVVLAGRDEAVDLFMTSAALDETEREGLHRRIAEVMAEHGVGLGDVRLNGEALTPSGKGGIHGYSG